MANGWRAEEKRGVKLAVCTQITLNVTEISAVLSQCDGVTGHRTNSTLHPPLVMSSDASLAAAATPVSSIQSGEFLSALASSGLYQRPKVLTRTAVTSVGGEVPAKLPDIEFSCVF